MEATESPDVALHHYSQLLDAHPTNMVGGERLNIRPSLKTNCRPYGNAKFLF
jgi:hypothetical protein